MSISKNTSFLANQVKNVRIHFGGLRSCDSLDGFGAKLNNGTICYKNTVIYGEITVFGTPGETRTHYLALRRRTLYPGELRGHDVTQSIVPKKRAAVNKTWENFLWEDKEYANIH